jgi:hypothetical protein
MRRLLTATLVVTLGGITACSSTPDPKAEWTSAMRTAGSGPAATDRGPAGAVLRDSTP